MNLKFSQRILLINFWVLLLAAILMVLLYETEMLAPGTLLFSSDFVFLMQVIMEFLTIAVIPLALKLFAFKAVKRKLVNGKGSALLPWGTVRINMLCLPMLVNTFMYYQTMSPAFGYMAIILSCVSFSYIHPWRDVCLKQKIFQHNICFSGIMLIIFILPIYIIR